MSVGWIGEGIHIAILVAITGSACIRVKNIDSAPLDTTFNLVL